MNVDNVKNYFDDFFGGLTNKIGMDLKNLLIGVLLAAVLYFIYQIIDKNLSKKVEKIPHIDNNVKKIGQTIIKVIYIFFSVMLVASLIGINTSSLIAAFSVLGIAISLSIQQIMGNVANAFAIILNKPFKIGDHVKVNDMEGTIKSISFVNTKIVTFDNDIIIIPNNVIGNAIIYNYSLNVDRRIVLEIGINYDEDSEMVRKTILDTLQNYDKIIKEKKVTVSMSKLDDSAVVYIIRFYAKESDYLEVKEKALEDIKNALDKNKINFAYPVRVVKMVNEK